MAIFLVILPLFPIWLMAISIKMEWYHDQRFKQSIQILDYDLDIIDPLSPYYKQCPFWQVLQTQIILDGIKCKYSDLKKLYTHLIWTKVMREGLLTAACIIIAGDARRSFNSSMYHCYNSVHCGRLWYLQMVHHPVFAEKTLDLREYEMMVVDEGKTRGLGLKINAHHLGGHGGEIDKVEVPW
jgi:hypothetical protein